MDSYLTPTLTFGVPGLLQGITSHPMDNVGKREKLLLRWVRELGLLLLRIYPHSVLPPIPEPTVLQWLASEVKIFASCQNVITTHTRERA